MKYIKTAAKEVPVKENYDVVVAGGGVAGIAAALAAARQGARVALFEKQCLLGGLATLGNITIYLPLCDGMGNQVIFGIGEELLRLSIKYGYEARYPKAWLEGGTLEEKKKTRFAVEYNPNMFAIAAEQLLISEGVEIYYDTKIIDVIVSSGVIEYLVVDNKEGKGAFSADCVVDCTGDADICALSGEDTEKFAKNRLAAWYYHSTAEGYRLQPISVQYASAQPESEPYYDGLCEKDINALIIRGHDAILKDVLKKRQESGNENIMPVTVPTVPSFRMTRRLAGAYTLDESEAHKSFDDCVGKTGDWRNAGPVFDIPLRCLHGLKIGNLFAAGRCISVTTPMWEITRVIPTCAVTGEAAGIAAALCARKGVSAWDLEAASVQKLSNLPSPK